MHVGTWNYMAPELQREEEIFGMNFSDPYILLNIISCVDYERADIWAVGCIMHFM